MYLNNIYIGQVIKLPNSCASTYKRNIYIHKTNKKWYSKMKIYIYKLYIYLYIYIYIKIGVYNKSVTEAPELNSSRNKL